MVTFDPEVEFTEHSSGVWKCSLFVICHCVWCDENVRDWIKQISSYGTANHRSDSVFAVWKKTCFESL